MSTYICLFVCGEQKEFLSDKAVPNSFSVVINFMLLWAGVSSTKHRYQRGVSDRDVTQVYNQ